MTQRARVLQMLQNAGSEGVSSKTFIASYMPRAAARIQELRDEGYEIESEREGKYVRYRLLAGVGADQVPSQEACAADSEYAHKTYKGGVHSGRGSTGGRGQACSAPADANGAPADAASGAPARSVPSMFDADDCLDWGDAA